MKIPVWNYAVPVNLMITTLILLLPGISLSDEPALKPQSALFATVGGIEITQKALDDAINRRVRTTLYHGQPPADKLAALRKEVSSDLIDRTLQTQEAKKRGLVPDQEKIQLSMGRMDGYMKQRGHEYSKADKQQANDFLIQEDLISQLREKVQDVAAPASSEVEAFYKANPQLFTEPEQLRLSVLLLKVAPSSTKDVWVAARKEAADLLIQLNKGADFAEQAKLRSTDPSADKGGDMGYLHKGMLAKSVEGVVDKLEVGQVSEPIMVLEGIAIFKLTGRMAAVLHSFDSVNKRASELYRKQLGITAWQDLKKKLRQGNPPEYHQLVTKN
jgi:parvulin-like peptidyl-prolyl isomerase